MVIVNTVEMENSQGINQTNRIHSSHDYVKPVKQISKSRLDLEITSRMRIGVFVYIKTKIANLPTVKKEDPNGGNVIVERTYRRADDPYGPEIGPSDKTHALRYGSQYVIVGDVDKAAMKYEADKCLKVIGFFPKDEFGIHRCMSNADCMAAEPTNDQAVLAMGVLVQAMLDTGTVALARFSARANAEPKLVCLYPYKEEAFDCLYSVQVPFSEDSRENTLLFPSLPEPSDALLDAVDSYIDSRLMSPGDLDPSVTPNPTLLRFWETVAGRAASNDEALIAPLGETGRRLAEIAETPETNSAVERILTECPLTELAEDATEKKRKKFWMDTAARELIQPVGQIDTKRIRVSGEDAPVAFSQNTPVQDFNRMVEKG
jgi:hypothetical protein